MKNEHTLLRAAIVQKFRSLHETFTDLNSDIAQLHSELALQDTDARYVFSSLSRLLAFSDQVHLTLSLMGEDVRVIERTGTDSTNLAWNDQIEECFDEWFSRGGIGNGKVH